MSIYANGELGGNCLAVDLNDDNFDSIYLEYDDIEALENDMELEEIEDDLPGVNIADAPLSAQKHDLLAVKLGRSWKRFARMTELFIEAEIEDIEYSCNSLYERCYQMLIHWGRKSTKVITVSMVTAILISIQRNDLARDLDEEYYPIENPSVTHSIFDLSHNMYWNWKDFARETGIFTELEIANIDEEEKNVHDKCHKMLMLWQEKSILEVSIEDIKFNLSKMKHGVYERVIRYTVDSGSDIRKIKVRPHHGLEELNKELLNIDKYLSLLKVQYIDCHSNGEVITCDNESQLDLAIFEENIKDFNVITKRKWWLLFQNSMRTRPN